jgi:hypothetical protein
MTRLTLPAVRIATAATAALGGLGLVLLAPGTPASAVVTPVCTAGTCVLTFTVVDAEDSWTPPAGVTAANIVLDGGGGGAAIGPEPGGQGGQVTTHVSGLIVSDTIEVAVGSAGTDGTDIAAGLGGAPGGGNGGSSGTGGGGGSSALVVNGTLVSMAGGGGGAGAGNSSGGGFGGSVSDVSGGDGEHGSGGSGGEGGVGQDAGGSGGGGGGSGQAGGSQSGLAPGVGGGGGSSDIGRGGGAGGAGDPGGQGGGGTSDDGSGGGGGAAGQNLCDAETVGNIVVTQDACITTASSLTGDGQITITYADPSAVTTTTASTTTTTTTAAVTTTTVRSAATGGSGTPGSTSTPAVLAVTGIDLNQELLGGITLIALGGLVLSSLAIGRRKRTTHSA